MIEAQDKKIIIVLGAGRCGTSLLMQVLFKLGMSISENLVPAKSHNPLGPMEDTDVAHVYDKIILPKIGSNRVLPINYKIDFTTDLENECISKLINITDKNIKRSSTIWGFKDPFTSCLLPLWFRIFNRMNILPVFLLSVRNPEQSVISRRKHFGIIEPIGELAWLNAYTDALLQTAANCYIVHYEDWFSKPEELAQGLIKYTGLDQYFDGDACQVSKDVVKPHLNRSVYDEYAVQNQYVLDLYSALKECRGDVFDIKKLMATVKKCRKAMDSFKGWYLDTKNKIREKERLQEIIAAKAHSLQKEQEYLRTPKNHLKEIKKQFSDSLAAEQKTVELLRTDLKDIKNQLTNCMRTEQEIMELLRAGLIDVNDRLGPLKSHHQYNKIVNQLYYSLRELEMHYHTIKGSLRWKIGSFLYDAKQLFLLGKRKSTAMDRLNHIFLQYKNFFKKQEQRDSAQGYYFYLSLITDTKNAFSELFASRKWKIGNRIATFLKRDPIEKYESLIKKRINFVYNKIDSRIPDEHEKIGVLKKNFFSYSEKIEAHKTDIRKHTFKKKIFKLYPKVSYIIPVFNKEKYIGKCIDSLLSNKYKNIEIICIDDNSFDNSSRILQQYAINESSVKFFSNKTNCGASISRNIGIDKSSGDYLFFLDADDFIADNSIERMIEIGENNGCDIVRGKITGVTNDGKFYKLAAEHLLHTESKNRVSWINEESLWFYWYFTANLYKARFIKDNRIKFPSNLRNEDPFFLCRSFLAANNISLYSDIAYYYRVGDEQKNKSPTLSFLTGWSMGYYYLYQLIQNQYKQAQYFMVHFPSLLNHSKNITKYLPEEQAINLLKYIKLIFKNANLEYYENPTCQPWLRKKSFHKNYIEYILKLKSESLNKIYSYLLDV